MKESEETLKDLIKQSGKSFKVNATENDWTIISKHLEKKKRRFFAVWIWSAGIALLAGGISLFMFSSGDKNKASVFKNENNTIVTSRKNAALKNNEKTIAKIESNPVANSQKDISIPGNSKMVAHEGSIHKIKSETPVITSTVPANKKIILANNKGIASAQGGIKNENSMAKNSSLPPINNPNENHSAPVLNNAIANNLQEASSTSSAHQNIIEKEIKGNSILSDSTREIKPRDVASDKTKDTSALKLPPALKKPSVIKGMEGVFYTGFTYSWDIPSRKTIKNPGLTAFENQSAGGIFKVTPKSFYNASAIVGYTRKRWSFQTGINYSKITESTDYNYISRIDTVYLPITGQDPRKTFDTVRIKQNGTNTFTYLSIPFAARYAVPVSHHLSIGMEAGASINFLLQAKGVMVPASKPDTLVPIKRNALNTVNYSIFLGPALMYNSGKFSFEAMPVYRKIFNSVFNDAVAEKVYYSSFGINVGIIYRLK